MPFVYGSIGYGHGANRGAYGSKTTPHLEIVSPVWVRLAKRPDLDMLSKYDVGGHDNVARLLTGGEDAH